MNPYTLAHPYCLFCLTACMVAWVAGEAWLLLRRPTAVSYQESVTDWALGAVSLIALLVPFQLAFSGANSPSPAWAYSAVGLAALAAGIGLRFYSIVTLGSLFTTTLTISPGHTLITRGPYRYMRHPSYTGAMLALLGLALDTGSPYALLCPIMIAPGIVYRIKREERMLVREFGDEYVRYRAGTHALWPRWSGPKEVREAIR